MVPRFVDSVCVKWCSTCELRHHGTELFLVNYVRISIVKGANMRHLQHHGTELCLEASKRPVAWKTF